MSATTEPLAPPELSGFHEATRRWLSQVFDGPTPAQSKAWPAIARGESTLLLAPTGSGKTLAAFLVAIDRLMFPREEEVETKPGVRTLYISPLKALGVDVERNLRAPLAGIRAVAERDGFDYHLPTIGVRSGDTPPDERRRLSRTPPEILITTPESLYLMLTSRARETLQAVDTVIVDEIHSLVRTKRGTHLFLSLERLEKLRDVRWPSKAVDSVVNESGTAVEGHPTSPLQRIGLSATQRPLEEVARLLGGGEATANPEETPSPRPVTIIEAGRRKQLELTVEVPVEDMARMAESVGGNTLGGQPAIGSIWPAMHPRLLQLIRAHRSTMIFVNSRRLAERLALAINELAAEETEDETPIEIAAAHHGSVAKDKRLEIEDRLKRGQLPAIVATSSLELGIDMGAVDLVIQIEAPPSIASGVQRIGRAGHQVGAPSTGVIFPKYRGDLLACSAAITRMRDGEVEETFYPRNPLDVLAQQIVAMVALDARDVDEVYATVRGAAPFFDLPRSAFEEVLDLLSGRYPSSEFSELRPRIVWDRVAGRLTPRRGAQRLAVANAGTIPDRGLYGVFLVGENGASGSRVGELDEEMVFETSVGDVFLLGASSWRAIEITHDRVLVAPAPGEPGRMPFWRGDSPGRPAEFGRAIGALTQQLLRMPREDAVGKLIDEHALDQRAADNLVNYLHDQRDATGEVPSDQTIVVERFIDEVGDWRVIILSPFGSRVHAPWAMSVAAKLRAETGSEIDVTWTDDGIVLRLLETDDPPGVAELFPSADMIEDAVVKELGSTAMFASHFRENSARALLLPKRQPNRRTPLWLQRRKSAGLLQVASRYERFPMLMETYRECLRDVFDLKELKQLLRDIEQRRMRVHIADTQRPSPFAAALMYNYTANYLYEGDAPLAERRAAALSLDHAQLRELLGDAELRELLDADVVETLQLELQWLTPNRAIKHADALHDLLLQLGDLTQAEIHTRSDSPCVASGEVDQWIDDLTCAKRIIEVRIHDESRYIAAEDAGRYRDALGVVPPLGLPEAFLGTVTDALADLVARFARTHGPFHAEEVAARLAIGVGPISTALAQLSASNRLLEGEFLPVQLARGRGREWCDADVLKLLKRRSLAALRKQVEPVEQQSFATFLVHWQSLDRRRRGLDGLLDVIEQLQGAALPASDLHRIFAARIEEYEPAMLDELCVAGEILWQGRESLGPADGRVAIYLTDDAPKLLAEATALEDETEQTIEQLLRSRGALLFDEITHALGGFPNDVIDALWRLVWAGQVTNDTFAPLRSLPAGVDKKRSNRRHARFRSRRRGRLPGSEGRWSLLRARSEEDITPTQRQTALAMQLLERYGVVTREIVTSEGIAGRFSGLYPIYKAMEESGRVRRGYFISGQGAAQFAAPGAEDRLRDRESGSGEEKTIVIAATDPANPYGAALKWPDTSDEVARPQRSAGARVVLNNGRLLAHLNKSATRLLTFLPTDEPEHSTSRNALLKALASSARQSSPIHLQIIDGQPAHDSPLSTHLAGAGFVALRDGYVHRGESEERAPPRRGDRRHA